MSNKIRILSFLLAMVVFLSATGHVFIAHYCAMEQSGCIEKADCCCTNDAKGNGDGFADNTTCCINSTQYLINPFSIRQPEKHFTFLKIEAKEFRLYNNFFNSHYITISSVKQFADKPGPPGIQDLLTKISTFQI